MVRSANDHQKLIIFHKTSKYFLCLPLHCHHCSSQQCFPLFPCKNTFGVHVFVLFSQHIIEFPSAFLLSFSVRLCDMGLTSRRQLFWSGPRDCQKKNLITAAIARTTWHTKLQGQTPKLPVRNLMPLA